MLAVKDDSRALLLVTGIVFLSRIPFIFAGYGSEEDAWGLILIARNISLSGIYEVSRMPGHPVQEYLLSLIWDWPAWSLNLLTAIVSSIGVFFFMKSLQRLQIPQVIPAGIALAFAPVFYMHSTNIMDYTWALSLMMLALYLTVSGRYAVAGIVIGIACGFRVTAGAIALPLALWHFMHHKSIKAVFVSGMLTLAAALVCFIPAIQVYGSSFFTYYEYFPYPPVMKNIYKGTVGAWGIMGMVAVMAAAAVMIIRAGKSVRTHGQRAVIFLCITALVLYTYSFVKVPQKTAFVIPLIPFFIILSALFLSHRQMMLFAAAMVFSSFFMGINLNDPIRGSKASAMSVHFKVGETPVVFDPLQGIVPADHAKRKVKMEYAQSVVEQLDSVKEKTVIIAGWWQNELNYFSLKKKNPFVSYLYYVDEPVLRDSIAAGCRIYYLPEQDTWNDIRWKKTFTGSIAGPLKQ